MPQPPPPLPNQSNTQKLQMPDSHEEALRAFEEKIKQKKDEHRKHLENLRKLVEQKDASLKSQSRNQTELANELNMLRERRDNELAAQLHAQDNVGNMRMLNKLVKAHIHANQSAGREFERIMPRVVQYVDSAERLLADAIAKEARDHLQHQQAVAELRQRLAALAESRESYNNWYAHMDASAVGERIAKVDVVYDEISRINEDNARMAQDIEHYRKDYHQKKAQVVLQKKELEEKRAACAEDIMKQTSIIMDQEERVKSQKCMSETLQETLATRQIMTKEAGEESSKLQEQLLTLESTNAAESTALIELRQRTQGMQKELEDKMQILKQKQAEESSLTEKVKALEEMRSTKFWERNSAQTAWESEKESMLNVLSELKKEKDRMGALDKEEELQRSKMQEFLEKCERDKNSWESEKVLLTETLKGKENEESELVEKMSNLKGKLTANSTKMEKDNHNTTQRINATNKDVNTIKEKLDIVKQKKENTIQLELYLSEELSTWKEDCAILDEDKTRKDSVQTKNDESWAKEEAALSAELERQENATDDRKKLMKQLENESASGRNDDIRNSNDMEVKMVKSEIATYKERQEADRKRLSALMSDTQTSTHTRAAWDTKIEACRKELTSLQRQKQLKALHNIMPVKETEDMRRVEKGPTEAAAPALAAPRPPPPLPAAHRQFFSTHGRNTHGRSSLAASSARMHMQGAAPVAPDAGERERSASAPAEAKRRHSSSAPAQPVKQQKKPDSDLEYDFSDF